ncbi:hypothetical protein [Pseudomonas fulva]|uniref:hypothetical protein n=1 Tax=Pseudomonas fulva TaxID=47880 RepID=UPI0018AB6259|nr:hypothetical protein [Pseudomonas fulva]MBF8680113.1 hypothetical protein [Pseudomonas fulva]MBF8718547.1 hypothetical protein [Pseudomonas fulva]MBF8783654.1 hypothetical protein [Pseudomonas fulva]
MPKTTHSDIPLQDRGDDHAKSAGEQGESSDYKACLLDKKKLEQELESTRATSVERKNSLREAHHTIANHEFTIETLKKELSDQNSKQSELIKKLHVLEGQVALLSELVGRS